MVPIAEQETVIQFDRDNKKCTIWTSDSTMMTKLDKLCKSTPTYYKFVRETKTQDGNLVGKYYELLDKKLLSFRTSIIKRELSDEQKAIMIERLRKVKK